MAEHELPQQSKPVVRVKSNRYQPSKAELEEPIYIDATPEELARAVVRAVKVVEH